MLVEIIYKYTKLSITLSWIITVTIFSYSVKPQYSDISGVVIAEKQPYMT